MGTWTVRRPDKFFIIPYHGKINECSLFFINRLKAGYDTHGYESYMLCFM